MNKQLPKKNITLNNPFTKVNNAMSKRFDGLEGQISNLSMIIIKGCDTIIEKIDNIALRMERKIEGTDRRLNIIDSDTVSKVEFVELLHRVEKVEKKVGIK